MNHLQPQIFSAKTLSKSQLDFCQKQNISITALDFIEIQPIETEETNEQINRLAQKKGVAIFTSANGVDAVFPKLKNTPDWTYYCIAGKTKDHLTKFVLEDQILGMATHGKDLAEKIVLDQKAKEVFFFCSQIRRPTIPDILSKNKIQIKEVNVYETVEMPHKLTNDFDGILFFSPSQVHSFFSVNQISYKTVFFAIGHTTEDEIRKYKPQAKIILPDFPSVDKLLNCLAAYNF